MKKEKNKEKLSVINPDAAGIDVGSRESYVCVPVDRDEKNVRKFAAFTSDIREMAAWLKKCGVKTVAMESTGIYWLPIFQILETSGFEIILVNARHVKNVPGRKTDVTDCQWLQINYVCNKNLDNLRSKFLLLIVLCQSALIWH